MIAIGIDPSMNSTGICILKYDDNDNIISEHFFIVKPNKLTRNEKQAQEQNENIHYELYEKTDLKPYNDENLYHEFYKSKNICNIGDAIYKVIKNNIEENEEIYIVQEGISYGSKIRTKAIYDLAGLNYILRYIMLRDTCVHMCVCPPSNIKKFATDNGNCPKEMIVNAFIDKHKDLSLPKIDDIADAYFMACYAHHLKFSEK